MTIKHMILLVACLSLCACGRSDKPLAGQKVGKPYMVGGKMYYPNADISYDEVGIASWYGPGFHGKYTANGEVYDQHGLTAAHTTLPLPSMVRVTNLDNGKSAIIRVNDRGPFAESRIIDLSRGSANALGITGLARVRVQYLHEETMAYLNERGIKPSTQLAQASRQQDQPRDILPLQASDEEIQREEEEVKIQTADLQEFKPRPVQRFTLVSDAQAQEISSQDLPPPASAQAPAEEEPLRGRTTPAPKLIRLGEEPKDMPRIDTSSEARRFEKIQAEEVTEETEEKAEPAPFKRVQPQVSQAASGEAPTPGLYVQAGSFSSRDNAIALADKLSSVGPSEVNMIEISGKTWYRVRIGPIKGNANTILTKVKDLGLTDAKLIHQ